MVHGNVYDLKYYYNDTTYNTTIPKPITGKREKTHFASHLMRYGKHISLDKNWDFFTTICKVAYNMLRRYIWQTTTSYFMTNSQ